MARQRSFSLGRSRAESWLQLSQRQRVGFLSYLPGLDHWEAAARDGAWPPVYSLLEYRDARQNVRIQMQYLGDTYTTVVFVVTSKIKS